jgi:protein-S-isoprenylcysteine O-methyltransferase Ste14
MVFRADGTVRRWSGGAVFDRRGRNAVTDNPYLVVRAAAVYLAALAIIITVIVRRPNRPNLVGAMMAFAWNLAALLLVHLVAMRAGWWTFDASGGELLGFPVDLWLAWAVLWGPVPALALPRAPVAAIVALALLVDLIAMPAAAPVVRLGDQWLIGECVALAGCVIPAQLLARWTRDDRHLIGRASLQVIAFSILLVLLIPAVALEGTGTTIARIDGPPWLLSIAVQLIAIPAILGLAAVQEFVTRGNGTPVPFDPPKTLVTTGPYAYVTNPMQLSAIVCLMAVAVAVGSIWVAIAAVVAHVYSAGIAEWDEGEDLRRRFGDSWTAYRARVRSWCPSWRPWYGEVPIGTLFVSSECGMCNEVAMWFARRQPKGLAIAAAETLTPPPRRITYRAADGYEVAGVAAVGRALEHINLAYASAGFAIRLPLVSALIQLIVDASGGGPRPIRSDGRVRPIRSPRTDA